VRADAGSRLRGTRSNNVGRVLTRDELVARLRAADEAWSTVRGVVRHWRNQELTNAAFHEHFERLKSGGTLTWSIAFSNDDRDNDPIVEAVYAVAFDSGGRRRRAVVTSRRNEEWLPDKVVIDGAHWWARTGDSITTNGGDERYQMGGADMVALLLPSDVLAGFDVQPAADYETVAGRSCQIARAVRRSHDPNGYRPGSRVFDMIEGGDHFRLSVDGETGVLLRVLKEFGGQAAEIVEFSEITFDEPLDDGLFAPLS
jgi:hypothetical protein